MRGYPFEVIRHLAVLLTLNQEALVIGRAVFANAIAIATLPSLGTTCGFWLWSR
jgi:hypothetical protein